MKDKVTLWGGGKPIDFLIDRIGVDMIECIVSNYGDKKSIRNIPIIDQDLFIKDYCEKIKTVLLTTQMTNSSFEIMDVLDRVEVKNIGILRPCSYKYSDGREGNLLDSDDFVWYCKEGKTTPVIPRVEVNLIDGCNLNCKACAHFSSIYSADSIYPLREYECALDRLRKIGQVVRIRLLGGEPFLLRNLDQYVLATRERLAETDIEIVTNGLLFERVSDKVFMAIRESEANVSISLYPPTSMRLQSIKKRLNDEHIRYSVSDQVIERFHRNLTMEPLHDGRRSSKTCMQAGCMFLRNGYIYKCPTAGCIEDYYDKYGIVDDRPEITRIDLFTKDDSEIYMSMKKMAIDTIPLCSYCVEIPEMISWEVKPRPEKQDWLYMGKKDFEEHYE